MSTDYCLLTSTLLRGSHWLTPVDLASRQVTATSSLCGGASVLSFEPNKIFAITSRYPILFNIYLFIYEFSKILFKNLCNLCLGSCWADTDWFLSVAAAAALEKYILRKLSISRSHIAQNFSSLEHNEHIMNGIFSQLNWILIDTV